MNFHIKQKFRIIPLIFLFTLFLINSCGFYKRSDVKDNPINESDKREKNIQEGRGITNIIKKGRSGSFDFATSNVLWRATMDVLDFTPLSNVDYGGGIIITDWYSDNKNESVKISVQFLSNEVRADGLNVKIYKKKCNINEACKTLKVDGVLNTEIKLAILKKATLLKKGDAKKSGQGNYRVVPTNE